jgi:hypothetical protein
MALVFKQLFDEFSAIYSYLLADSESGKEHRKN